MKGKVEKKFGPKLVGTSSTLPGPLSPGPLDLGPGTMYPLNPPLAGPAGFSNYKVCLFTQLEYMVLVNNEARSSLSVLVTLNIIRPLLAYTGPYSATQCLPVTTKIK